MLFCHHRPTTPPATTIQLFVIIVVTLHIKYQIRFNRQILAQVVSFSLETLIADARSKPRAPRDVVLLTHKREMAA